MEDTFGTGVATEEVLDTPEGAASSDPLAGLFPDTPAVEKDKPKPDHHRATVRSVELKTFDSGATALIVNVQSQDEGFDDNYAIFLPKEFVEDIKVDARTLSTETPVNEKTGKAGLSQRQKYARAVRNTDNTAELQGLLALARKQERNLGEIAQATNIRELAEAYNSILSGMSIGFSRSADKNAEDPAFADRLRVRRLWDIAEVENPKKHAKGRRAWEA